MKDPRSIKILRIWCLVATLFWVVIILLFSIFHMVNQRQHAIEIGRIIGRLALTKNTVYCSWNPSRSDAGTPVPKDKITNSNLPQPSGQKQIGSSSSTLSLVKPAYVIQPFRGMGKGKDGLKAHVVSLRPINENNLADAWESSALQLLGTREEEFSELIEINGERFMRLITPLVVQERCLQCHADQGYALGDQRGGISVSVPMKDIFATNCSITLKQSFYFLFALFAGLGGIFLFYHLFKRQNYKRLQAETKARAFEEQWHSTFDDMDSIVTIQTVDYKIKQINKTGCNTLGVTQEEAIGMTCYQLFGGRDKACECCQKQRNLEDFKPFNIEITHERLGKTFFISATPFVNQYGEEKGIIHFARDITSDKKIQKQLRHAQKMEAIGTLAGGIAHDFNNLLMAILGYSDILRYDLPEGSKNRAYIEEVMKAGTKAKELVKQILTFSRQSEREKRPLHLYLIVKEAVKLVRSSIPATIEVRDDIDSESGTILADPSQMHQIVMNLCTNGYQAMREITGILTISLKAVTIDNRQSDMEPGEYLNLIVSDTGPGMEKEVLSRIFEPYYTTKTVEEGSGLGLSVVHGIVQDHNGHIQVSSQPGKGAVFSIFFPRLVKEPAESTGDSSGSISIPRGDEKILIVDDETTIVEMLSQMLTSLGYTVTSQTSSLDALTDFQRNPNSYDLVITDMAMPYLTGKDLSDKLLSIRPDIPIILCTGFSELIDNDQAKLLGVKRLVMKPIIKKDIGNLVRDVLDEKKEQESVKN